jgi:hypothetical protein
MAQVSRRRGAPGRGVQERFRRPGKHVAMPGRHRLVVAALFVGLAGLGLGACGGSSKSSSGAGGGSPGAVSAEAKSAATGDIPDNQVFLTFRNRAAGYSIKYPEGWTRRGSDRAVTFQDKNNIVQIAVGAAGAPTPASVARELARERSASSTLRAGAPASVRVKGAPAVKVTYTTVSKPNPVTGKRVLLVVDRYELARSGKRATVDLGTPKGVDNVDAYRMMVESFRWL